MSSEWIRAAACCVCLALGHLPSAGFANTSISELACQDRGFDAARIGAFREVEQPSGDSTYLFKVEVERLRLEGLKGRDVSAVARSLALREFSNSYARRQPIGPGEFQLVVERVQSAVVSCQQVQVVVYWVSRSQLRWERSELSTIGSTLEEVRRIFDGERGLGLRP
jgi:hypothetical protein